MRTKLILRKNKSASQYFFSLAAGKKKDKACNLIPETFKMQIFSISKSAGNKKRLFETKAVHGNFYVSLPRFFVTNLFSLRRKESKYFHAKRGKKKEKEGGRGNDKNATRLPLSLSVSLPASLLFSCRHTHTLCFKHWSHARSISFDLREGKKIERDWL